MSATTTKFIMIRDINGYNGFGIPQTNNAVDTLLAQDVEQHTTVPSDYSYYLAIFYYEAGATVFVSNTGTADAAGASFSATDSILNPAAFIVQSGTTLSFITHDISAYVTVSYYSLPNYGTATI